MYPKTHHFVPPHRVLQAEGRARSGSEFARFEEQVDGLFGDVVTDEFGGFDEGGGEVEGEVEAEDSSTWG